MALDLTIKSILDNVEYNGYALWDTTPMQYMFRLNSFYQILSGLIKDVQGATVTLKKLTKAPASRAGINEITGSAINNIGDIKSGYLATKCILVDVNASGAITAVTPITSANIKLAKGSKLATPQELENSPELVVPFNGTITTIAGDFSTLNDALLTTAGTYLVKASHVYKEVDAKIINASANIMIPNKAKQQTAVRNKFSIEGENVFVKSGRDQAIYNAPRKGTGIFREWNQVEVELSQVNMQEDIYNDSIDAAQLFTKNMLETIISDTHTTETYTTDGKRTARNEVFNNITTPTPESSIANAITNNKSVYQSVSYFGKLGSLMDAYDTATTPADRDTAANAVYDWIVKEINMAGMTGFVLPNAVIQMSMQLQTIIQMSPKYKNFGDITKQEIAQGFLGKINGIPFMPNYSLGSYDTNTIIPTDVTYSGTYNEADISGFKTYAGTYTVHLLFIELNPARFELAQQLYQEMQIVPGDSKEMKILRAKSALYNDLYVYEPAAIRLYGKVV